MIRLLSRNPLGSLILTEFPNPNTVPSYAILSHTWDVDNKKEVTFEDVETGRAKDKPSYHKIEFCAEKAAAQDLQYFWIDTCCINRKDLSELSEAIVSMFKWYQKASCCYVYLTDVPSRFDIHRDISSDQGITAFRNSRWFTRGWTLQELIAPRNVDFFASNGEFLGSRQSLKQLICMATNIEPKVLSGYPVSEFDFAERQSWASHRETTREEDIVYALMGICEVSMPVLYGEGRERASERLENEIHRQQQRRSKRKQDIKEDESPYTLKRRRGDLNAAVTDHHSPKAIEDNLIKVLRFGQMEDRRLNIKSSYKTTCNWLLHDPTYTNWFNAEKYYEHHGFFWIKGKPGSGKSTLTKFIFEHVQLCLKNVTLLSFFFNARGSDLERSTIGLYRSLLVQLLDSFPFIQSRLRSSYLRGEPWDERLQTDVTALSRLLAQAISLIREQNIMLIIDALDECAENEVRDMVRFFEELGDSAISNRCEFRVLFSSRHYPRVTAERSVELVLDDQSGHADDIKLYISERLRAGNGKHIESIRREICQKSSGIFMWVVLVVEILNEAFDQGDVQELREKLREVPTDLKGLFNKIITRDKNNMPKTLLCLQWILYAVRPLEPTELYFAVLSGLHPDQDPTPWDRERTSLDDMARFILSSSKGLAEVTKTQGAIEKGTVQFIHESVRDYLLGDHGLGEMWSELSTNTTGLCHDRLTQCCYKVATFDCSSHLPFPSRLGDKSTQEARKARNIIRSKLPFLEYACLNMYSHAELAQSHGINQMALLDREVHGKWAHNYSKFNLVSAPPGENLLTFFACRNFCNLANLLLTSGADVNAGDYEYGTALQAAAEYGRKRMVELLLDRGADINANGGRYGTALQAAAKYGRKRMVELLLDRGADINANDGIYGTALQAAVKYERKRIVELLLDRGADINVNDGIYGTTLQAAAISENKELVELLLDRGADINVNDGIYGTTLQAAAISENKELVELLLDRGADINANGGRYGTALQAAAKYGRKRMVELLLDRGADINANGGRYGTALQAAVKYGRKRMVELLLDRGADINANGGRYSTALQAAKDYGKQDIVDLLVASGAKS